MSLISFIKEAGEKLFGKGEAKAAHEALQAQIDSLKKELPAALVEAIKKDGSLGRRR